MSISTLSSYVLWFQTLFIYSFIYACTPGILQWKLTVGFYSMLDASVLYFIEVTSADPWLRYSRE